MVDTPGFGNNIDHKHAVRPITKYIRKCRDEQFRAETGARKETEADGDRLVHACVYFISPHSFLEIDRHFLRHVQRELAIVPVIAKTDTLTDEELAEYRAMLRDEFTKNNIQVYDFGEKSSELLEKRAFARGRERGEPLGIIARDGHYPWGTSQFQFAAHRTSPCSRICYCQNTRSRSSSTRRLGTQNIARDASGWATRRTPPSLLLFWLLSGGLWGCPCRSRRAPASLLSSNGAVLWRRASTGSCSSSPRRRRGGGPGSTSLQDLRRRRGAAGWSPSAAASARRRRRRRGAARSRRSFRRGRCAGRTSRFISRLSGPVLS